VILLRKGALGLGALAVLAVAFSAGVVVDQSYPEGLPSLAIGRSQGQLDRSATEQALRVIQAHYYDRQPDYGKLSDGTVRGMVQALGDPYTQYLSPSDYRAQLDQYAGRHAGMIGIQVDFANGYPVVAGILPNSPALLAGLQTDDVIVAVDGRSTQGLTQDATSTLIRGAAGSSVDLTVSRAGAARDLKVTRANFQSPTVQSIRLDGDVQYMRIYQFGDGTQREFDAQLRTGLPGARGLVLDLRGNGGGFVTAATSVISRFLASGEAFEERGRDGTADRTNVDGNDPAATLPLVILVDGNTASAAEIVSGSLQAHGRAPLVGATTFGKGSVQVDYQLANGGDLHLTIAHWYLPNGRSIDKKGLAPDVAVALPGRQSMFDVVEPARGHAADTQLNRALALLKGQ
jgi:carboxyl-terminal processing protease